jgi:hypothetical protein
MPSEDKREKKEEENRKRSRHEITKVGEDIIAALNAFQSYDRDR